MQRCPVATTPTAFAYGTTFSLANYEVWNGGVLTVGEDQPLADGDIFSIGLNHWQIDYDATTPGANFASEATGAHSFTITAMPVPEPGAASVEIIGIGMLVGLQRSRRRRV